MLWISAAFSSYFGLTVNWWKASSWLSIRPMGEKLTPPHSFPCGKVRTVNWVTIPKLLEPPLRAIHGFLFWLSLACTISPLARTTS